MLPMPFAVVDREVYMGDELQVTLSLDEVSELASVPLQEDERIVLLAVWNGRHEYRHSFVVGRGACVGDRDERVAVRFVSDECGGEFADERGDAVMTIDHV